MPGISEHAKKYNELGFNLVPLAYGQKTPAVPQLEPYFTNLMSGQEWEDDKHNIGVITGAISNLIVFDIDDQSSFEVFMQKVGSLLDAKLRNTFAVKTGKGYHFYFKTEPAEFPTGIDTTVLFEGEKGEIRVKGNRGYVVAPPSLHPSGKYYEGNDKPLQTISRADWDSVLIAFDTREAQKTPMEDLFKPEFRLTAGNNRHEAVMRVAESLIKRLAPLNYSEERIRREAETWNNDHCFPPLPPSEFDKQWQCAVKFMRKNIEKEGKEGEKGEKGEEGKEFYVQKFTNGTLAEAVVVNGLPFFLEIKDGEPALIEQIDTPATAITVKPIEPSSYLNKEYSFRSLDEIKSYIDRARTETYDSLYQKVRTQWTRYIKGDEEHLSVCAADTIFTYFQDKLGLTHYLGFVGDNGSGKSNNLRLFKELGYRAYFDVDVTPANIYQFMGSVEEGQGILIEDEADDFDESPEKVKIYKSGYTKGTSVSRIDTSFGRKQIRFWTFCFKAFSAEKSSDVKGFNDRVFYIQCTPGEPAYDILEVLNHANEDEYKRLFEELMDLRKLLLAFRLVHFEDVVPQVKLNIKGREKQLTESLIRLFKDSECLHEIMRSLSKLLKAKRDRKGGSLESLVFRVVYGLAPKHQYKIPNEELWREITASVPGEFVRQTYMTEDFGELSKKQVTGIIRDRFGGEPGRTGQERFFVFQKERLDVLAVHYNVEGAIRIVDPERDTCDTCSGILGYMSVPQASSA
jgi:hypothetical protein